MLRQAAGGGDAVEDRHPDVHHAHVGALAQRDLDRLGAVPRLAGDGDVLLRAEHRREPAADEGVVVRQQDPDHAPSATGQVLLAGAATWSNVAGGDASWFPVVAVATNLAWLGGWIAIAVALRRTGAASRIVAFCLPLSWVAMLPLSDLGGGLLSGAYWPALGVALSAGTLSRTAPAVTAPTAVSR